MLCHPTEIRPLSVREYAEIQQFPNDYEFSGPTASKYRQIGNADPIQLGQAIGSALRIIMATEADFNPNRELSTSLEVRLP